MSTGFFPPGPAEIAVGLGAAKSMLYLGLTEGAVQASEILFHRPVEADYAGSAGMPADISLQGRGIVATAAFKKFDPTVMSAVKRRYYSGTAGAISAGEIGSLLLTEGLFFPVMIRSQYVVKAQYTLYEPGLHLYYAFVSGQVRWDYSTNPQVVNVEFTGLTWVDSTTLSGLCWDTNISGFPPAT